MRGFSGFDEFISSRGGIASRRELLEAGWTPDELWFGRWYGNLDRVRHGWYGSRDLPPLARAAWSVGGPLACVSALVHHGAIAPDDPRVDPATIHVTLRTHAKRPTTLGPSATRLTVVYHWGDAAFDAAINTAVSAPHRHAVTLETARAQLARCAPARLPRRA